MSPRSSDWHFIVIYATHFRATDPFAGYEECGSHGHGSQDGPVDNQVFSLPSVDEVRQRRKTGYVHVCSPPEST